MVMHRRQPSQTQRQPKIQTVTVEMVIGLRHYPNEYNESFSFINGLVKTPKRVPRLGLGALGNYQPQDIGKRVYGNQVENEMQITKRTGMDIARRKHVGKMLIAQAREEYKGQKTIWGTTI